MISTQPCVVQLWRDDHWCAFFIPRLVKLAHHGVFISIDRQHGKTDEQLTRSRVAPTILEAGNAKWITGCQFNLPAYSLARLVIGLVEVIDQHQSKLSLPPCSAVTGFFCCSLASCVVGVAADLVVLSPSRYQTEPSQSTGDAF